MFFMVVGVVTVTAIGVSSTSDSMAMRGVQKIQANALAETGINVLYDTVCRDLAQNKKPASSISSQDLKATFHDTRVQGKWSARVKSIETTRVAPAPGHGPDSVSYTYDITLEGTGNAPNGTSSKILASFRLRRVLLTDTGGWAETAYVEFPGAVNSNTTIEIMSQGGLKTYDINTQDKEAHILANQGIFWKPKGVDKKDISKRDVIDVDGFILVPDQPTRAHYDNTKGLGGLGNSNGVKNYQSAAPWLNKHVPYKIIQDEVTPIGSPQNFPDWAQVSTMRNDWLKTAKSSPTSTVYGTSVNASALLSAKTGYKEIASPAYINGSLNVESGSKIFLVPTSSTDPSKNVVFVDGSVINKGEIVNLGVTLVIRDDYRDTNKATYRLQEQGGIFTELADVYRNASMVTLSPYKDSIVFSSGNSGRYGQIYAARGGIVVNSGADYNGVFTSGGLDSKATLQLSRNGNLLDPPIDTKRVLGGGVVIDPPGTAPFSLHFIREASKVIMPSGGGGNMGQYAEPVRANRLLNWRQLR